MSKVVEQIIVKKNEDGSGGTVTVITRSENGTQYASTAAFGGGTGETEAMATQRATQDSLNK